MSKYAQLIAVIDLLPSSNKLKVNTLFEITEDWCKAQGLTVSSDDVKSLGKRFLKEYETHGCDLVNSGTDDHHL